MNLTLPLRPGHLGPCRQAGAASCIPALALASFMTLAGAAETAAALATSPTADLDAELPTVSVRASTPTPARDDTMNPILPRTTLSERSLEQRQPASVFDLMDEVPGVAVQGGPRHSGMTFNVRGYSDSEDVRIELDGIAKGFEKYRFGGTFIEPDLLKAIEVRRGAQIESAGALGGTVSASTKDARDLLRRGQRWGARAKLGQASNNDEQHAFAALYGRPGDHSEVLLAQTRRQGDDIRLADGARLPLSATDMASSLMKGSWWASEAWKLSASWVRYQDQGLQAYDSTGGDPGLFGKTQRRIDDDTLSLSSLWQDEANGHEWRATLGNSRTRVRDHFEPGWSVFSTALTGPVNDDIDYQHRTLDSRVRLRLPVSDNVETAGQRPLQMSLNLGGQWGHTERASRRVTANDTFNQALYPGGYNSAQPPGTKDTEGAWLQLDARRGRWQWLPGVRWDRISSQVQGLNAKLLTQAGEPDHIDHTEFSPSLTTAYELQPQRWTWFATIARAFRPPLLDEAFMRGGYGYCTNDRLKRVTRRNSSVTVGVPGYSASDQVAPATGICANHYRPETSQGLDMGLSTQQPGLLGPGSQWQAKLTAFVNHTEHLLESLMAEPGGSGRLVQPGWERRRGWELETSLLWAAYRGSLGASRIRGTSFDGLQTQALLSAPGDRIHIGLARQLSWGEVSLRWQQVYARAYLQTNSSTGESVVQRQTGYRLLGLSMNWRINPDLDLRLTGENLANTAYLLDNGFGNGLGTSGPGRQLRLALSARY